jgi:thiamine-phosphate pyrophosphorylase
MSVHDRGQITGGGIDYYIWSPVFPTQSKPGLPGTGLPALKQARKAAKKTPVLALGGITPENVAACLEMGVHGVAVLSGIMDADNPTLATTSYLSTIHHGVQL